MKVSSLITGTTWEVRTAEYAFWSASFECDEGDQTILCNEQAWLVGPARQSERPENQERTRARGPGATHKDHGPWATRGQQPFLAAAWGDPGSGAGGRLDALSTSRDDHRKRTVSHCPDQSLSSWEPSTWEHRFSSATPIAAGRCWLTTSIAICTQTTPPCLPVCMRETASTTVRSGC